MSRVQPRVRLDWLTLIAVSASLLFQAGVAVWWGSAINTRVASLEKQVTDLASVPPTLARLDERSQAQGAQLDRLVAAQDRQDAAAAARRR